MHESKVDRAKLYRKECIVRAKVCLMDNDQQEYEIYTFKAAFTEKERSNSVVGDEPRLSRVGTVEEVLLPERRTPVLSGSPPVQSESERRELLGATQEAVTHRATPHS